MLRTNKHRTCVPLTVLYSNLQMLEDETQLQGEKLAQITASESMLRAQKSQLEDSSAKLSEAMELEMAARKAAESLVSEYEAGMEQRCVLECSTVWWPTVGSTVSLGWEGVCTCFLPLPV